jgi:NADPH:quinone reductase-like Zn-dependent oxidoreductase
VAEERKWKKPSNAMRGVPVVLKELIESGKLVPVVDRRYPLSDVPDAIRYLEAGHARGKGGHHYHGK